MSAFIEMRQVTKTYRRRDGMSPNWYGGMLAGDVIMGGIAGGSLLAMCLSDKVDMSCWHLLWASPFVVDLAYAAVRLALAKQPVLISKESSRDTQGLSPVSTAQQETGCEDVRDVSLGVPVASNRGDIAQVPQVPDAGPTTEVEGTGTVPVQAPVQVPFTNERRLSFTRDVLNTWAESPELRLWVVDQQGEGYPLRGIDRCRTITQHRDGIPEAERSPALQSACEPSLE